MKPFNLEAALRGEPVVTRDGRNVEQLVHFKLADAVFDLFGVVNGVVCSWPCTGRAGHADHDRDLFMAPKKKTVWVNFYNGGVACVYESKLEADEAASPHPREATIGGKAYPVEIDVD